MCSKTLALLIAPLALAQEVHLDRTVTFRLLAPKAEQVTLAMDFMPSSPKKMTKDNDGLWSVTVGPLAPSVYIYTFNVDGVTIADPVNPNIKLRARTSASMVEVPAATPALWEPRDVPHGAVEINWHKSAAINGEPDGSGSTRPPGMRRTPSSATPCSTSSTAPTTPPAAGLWPATPTSSSTTCSPRRKPSP